jgi:FG-GAP-like repeat
MRVPFIFATLVVLGSACSSPSSEAPADAPAPEPDGAPPPDTSPDAPPPLLGKACATAAVEVARIAGADIFSTTIGPAFYTSATSSFYTRDADGDGDADVLVFEYVSSTTSAYTYRARLFRYDSGTASFAPAVASTITLPAYGAELDLIADVDGDQRQDLVIGYTTEVPRTPYLYVARQAANGTFALQPSRIDVSTCGQSNDQRLEGIAVLDIDRDGKDDVLTTVSLGGLASPPVGLSLAKGTASGLGSSTCVASSTVTTPGFPAALAGARRFRTGDFDGDGATDLVAIYYVAGVEQMQLHVSRGPSTLEAVPGLAAAPYRLLVDHVPGRARDALIAVTVHADTTDLTRYATDAQTGISAATTVATLPAGSRPSGYAILYGFAASDFNGDGFTDIVEIGNQEYKTGPTPFAITCDRSATWQLGQGTFLADTRVLRSIDLDNDGQSELIARVGADVVVYKLQ